MISLPDVSWFDPQQGVLREYNYRAKRSLGQNFLFDMNVTHKIAQLGGDLTDCHVVEIGPGPGSLTKALLTRNPYHFTAIEKDLRFVTHLQVSLL
jgi:16S rRNA (adenine1518-N6/adenine1519-N6)-dimethyltransferase